jgi:hypothetical protein
VGASRRQTKIRRHASRRPPPPRPGRARGRGGGRRLASRAQRAAGLNVGPSPRTSRQVVVERPSQRNRAGTADGEDRETLSASPSSLPREERRACHDRDDTVSASDGERQRYTRADRFRLPRWQSHRTTALGGRRPTRPRAEATYPSH